MATTKLVTKVWIAPGCIVCDACETTAPDVFEVQHDNETCIIRPDALNAEFTKPRTEAIIQASAECPVDVIKYDTIEVDAADAPAPVAPSAPKPAAASHAAHGEPATAAAKASPAKPTEPPKPKVMDPAIQALLAATTVRGGFAVIDRGVKDLPDPLKRLAKQSPEDLPSDARYQKVLEKSKPKKEEEGATRREVMLAAGWTSIAVVLSGSGLVFARFMAPNVLEIEDPKKRCGPFSQYASMAVGDVDEQYKKDGFWLIREDERIAAVSIICTHLGCIPNWLPNDHKFKCPCHGSGYKPDGTNFEGPAPRPLERFKIYLDGDLVIVDRSKKFLAMGPNDTAVWGDPDAFIPA